LKIVRPRPAATPADCAVTSRRGDPAWAEIVKLKHKLGIVHAGRSIASSSNIAPQAFLETRDLAAAPALYKEEDK
jgi:hypothetical protein